MILYQHLFFKNNIINFNIQKQKKTFNFTLFNQEYKRLLNKNAPDSDFLTWFIGFTEGDGSFIIAKRGDLSFVITQDTRDILVLNMIKNILNLGKVIKQGKTTSRFVIQDKKGLYLMAVLFNENLVTHSKIQSFQKFALLLNKYNLKGSIQLPIIVNSFSWREAVNNNGGFIGDIVPNKLPSLSINLEFNPVIPTLQDNWICGFIDSEGCFSVSIGKISGFKICFDIAQNHIQNKYILDYFNLLFNVGKVYEHNVKGAYYYRVSGLNNITNLFDYFDTHQLRTKKLKSYILWKNLHGRLLNKDHLNPILRESLKVLASKVNNQWD